MEIEDSTTSPGTDEDNATAGDTLTEPSIPAVSDDEKAEFARFNEAADALGLGEDGAEPVQPDEPVSQPVEDVTAPTEAAESGQPAETENPSESVESAEPEGLSEALAAMRRDAMPDQQIKSWYDSDPDGFIKHGQSRAEAQRAVDQYGAEYRANQDEFEQWKAGGAEAGVEQQAYEQEYAALADASDEELAELAQLDDQPLNEDRASQIESALAPLKDHSYLDEAYEPLLKALQNVSSAPAAQSQAQAPEDVARLEALVEQQEARHRQLQYEMVDDRLAQSRDDLLSTFPSLKDQATHDAVLQKYDLCVETGDYDSIASNYEAAARWHFADQSVDQLRQELITGSKQRRRGTPRAPSASQRSQGASAIEREQVAFNELYAKHNMGDDGSTPTM